MKFNIVILLTFLGCVSCESQNTSEKAEQEIEKKTAVQDKDKVQVEVHARVDTTNIEIKEIAQLWINYLNSEPDKVSDNSYWNEGEKQLYRDFDLSRSLLFQFPSEQLLKFYKPKILSIEKEGDNYGIRTIYYAESIQHENRKSNPWAIQKIYAVQENNAWRLKNSLPLITAEWKKRKVGKISFIFPPNHQFNHELANKANELCNQITSKFQFPEWEPFDFYITQSGDELGRLLNFDFFFAGYTTGIGLNKKRILLSGLGSEYYPHEFVHLIVPRFERHELIEEGFATWQGGQGDKTFEESARLFANELAKNNTVSFSDVLNRSWGRQHAGFYTIGAILCSTAFEKGGISLVNELLEIPKDSETLIENLSSIFKLEKNDFDTFWRIAVLKYQDK